MWATGNWVCEECGIECGNGTATDRIRTTLPDVTGAMEWEKKRVEENDRYGKKHGK